MGHVDNLDVLVLKKENNIMNEGWICPRCGRVNAPSNTHCVCKPTNEKECKHDWMLEASLIGDMVQTNYYKCKNCGKTRIGYIEKV